MKLNKTVKLLIVIIILDTLFIIVALPSLLSFKYLFICCLGVGILSVLMSHFIVNKYWTITPTGITINMWEHSGWGDSIYWHNFDSREICGHLSPLLQVGDEIRSKFESGMMRDFLSYKLDPCKDPSDMFFAKVLEGDLTENYKKTKRGFFYAITFLLITMSSCVTSIPKYRAYEIEYVLGERTEIHHFVGKIHTTERGIYYTRQDTIIEFSPGMKVIETEVSGGIKSYHIYHKVGTQIREHVFTGFLQREDMGYSYQKGDTLIELYHNMEIRSLTIPKHLRNGN